MILPFSTQMNGKPTYFVEKILTGILEKKLTHEPDFNSLCPAAVIIQNKGTTYKIGFDTTIIHKPKFHTIREDKNDRWKVGNKIDFYINCRQKNMFRFAPVLPVVSVQKIEIEYLNNTGHWFKDAVVSIGESYIGRDEIETIAKNDGFDNVEDFFAYFNEDFKGKIIHWTDLRY